MQWPEGAIPASLPNFETNARQKRYYLLAQAAKRADIRHLCLGHHQDDQIETILMRLVRGKCGSLASFWGIAAEAPIPGDAEIDDELCSSQDKAWSRPLLRSIDRLEDREFREDDGSSASYSGSINSLGGSILPARRLNVSLHRPLLGFSKARILATCKANNVSFVSDPSNFDPQMTLRNAVRCLLTSHKVPRALSRDSIIKIHHRALHRLETVNSEVQRLLNVAQLTCLDLRSGSLMLRMPKFPHLLGWESSETLVLFLAQILRLVSPIDDYEASKSSQQAAAGIIFNNVYLHPPGRPASTSITTVAVNHVQILKEDQEHPPYHQYYVSWRLSRQRFNCGQIRKLSRTFTYCSDPEDGTVAGSWSNWIYWDRRYWIRICCANVAYLQRCVIRPFQPSDATDLRTQLNRDSRGVLMSLLHDAAPGKVRYTLPVIADDVGVRAFPTLDFAVPVHKRHNSRKMESKSGLLSWKVKYKCIDRKIIDMLGVHDSLCDRYRAAAEKYLQGRA